MHEHFQAMLDRLVEVSGVGQEVLGEVLARASQQAPAETSRVDISAGNPTARRPVDQRGIPQGTVSKAAKALKDEGLLEDGETYLKSQDGRTLAPLRLGRGFAIAGVKVSQRKGRPRAVTTALFGLDISRLLGVAYEEVKGSGDRWEKLADLVHGQVTALLADCDQDRASQGLAPLRLFGVGVEAGAPAYNGRIMPLSGQAGQPPIDLAARVRDQFDPDQETEQVVPIVVENDVNALAVLAIHEAHYAEPDLVVVSVFDEGVGGGLVMDGRLRRGGNGKAMEIGHLAVGFPPGEEPEARYLMAEPTAGAGFDGPCACGHFGHVDTLATPSRIRGELGVAKLGDMADVAASDKDYSRARAAFGRGGAALGRAMAHVSNTVNPTKLIVYLPIALAEPVPGSAAAAYLDGMRAEVSGAFAAGKHPDYIAVRAQPSGEKELALLGARAAAICVLESFIEHALRLDGCKSGLRRSGSRAPVE